ncbi:MAG: type 1 glutamine amidotransferase [Spirochaetes bacterium]|mgnify:FL=1|jgi:GMP synthase (glutamine-hydrolysing)|nr:type 1 glutamine amidotransferase [Spirochaetota bacterium]
MRIHCIQHVPFEGPAAVKDWALERGHVLSRTALYDNESLPAMDEFDWLIVMGGPMGVYDEDMYPWLAAEKRFIGRSIAEGHTVLGICLGAQLMAAALGGTVRANARREIGWFPVRLLPEAGRIPAFARLPREFDAFHWHGDTFGIPPGAVRAAESDACPAQAFSYNDRVIGLQFHLESTPESVEALVRNCAGELVEGAYTQDAGALRANPERFARLNALMRAFLEGMEEAAVT